MSETKKTNTMMTTSTDELLGAESKLDTVSARYSVGTSIETLSGVFVILSSLASAGYEDSSALTLLARSVDEVVADLDEVLGFLGGDSMSK